MTLFFAFAPNFVTPLQSKIIASIGVVFIILGIGLFISSFLRGDKSIPDHKQTASQISDIDLGKHLTWIEEKLKIWRSQLLAMSNKKGLIRILQSDVEKQRGFYQLVEHCPSIQKNLKDLRLTQAIHEAKLKKNLVTTEDAQWLKGRMKTLADAIDNSLSNSEYLTNHCSQCIKRYRQLSEISKISNPASIQSKEDSQN